MHTMPAYRPLGWLRFVMACAVLLGHSAWLADGNMLAAAALNSKMAASAVLAFFVLSGFVLSEAAVRFYRDRPVAFAINRTLKIVPGFLAAYALSLLVHALITGQGLLLRGIAFEGYNTVPAQIWGPGNLLYNALAIIPMFYVDTAKMLLGDGLYLFVRYIWAINVEVAFYSCMLAAIVWRQYLPTAGAATAWLAGLGSLLYVAALSFGTLGFYLTYAPYFALGVLLWRAQSRAAAAEFTAVALTIAAIAFHAPRQAGLVGTLVLASFVILIAVSGGVATSARWQRIDQYLGNLAYPVYLNQFAVLVAFSAYGMHGTRAWTLACLTTLIVSVIIHGLIERPLALVRTRVRLAQGTFAQHWPQGANEAIR
jgi:peptidoglycan/LPS O-acetylase OafA/YrhL